ncbi:MAG: TauD/TfdA family dioxygenase [Coleofasciculus sp. B1-GNL1-01]|uniref:TauD/TfdA family dioxygenase n=1 Tax=Coleofasciculus sp. B1-GNL1-01 TaxID=3068484 RepID=UPI0032F3E371
MPHIVSIKVENVMHMQETECLSMLKTINDSGFLIIECQDIYKNRESLLYLSNFFGKIVYHDHSCNDGVVPIMPIFNNPQYVNTTNQTLSLHTDGSFETNPPKVIAMQCEIAANRGGLTQLINAKLIYEYLYQIAPNDILMLFQPDVFTVTRNKKTATRAVFEYKNGRVQMAFRSDHAARILVKPQAVKLFNLIKDFISNPQHQTILKLKRNQILILDNTKVLHGRTSFKRTEKRKINRIWFNGKSNYSSYLRLGFLP